MIDKIQKHNEKIREKVRSLINGNKSDFKKWLKHCNKKDMISAILIYHYETGIELYKILDEFENFLYNYDVILDNRNKRMR